MATARKPKVLSEEDLVEFRTRWGALQASETAHNMMAEGYQAWASELKKKYRVPKNGPFLISLETGAINGAAEDTGNGR